MYANPIVLYSMLWYTMHIANICTCAYIAHLHTLMCVCVYLRASMYTYYLFICSANKGKQIFTGPCIFPAVVLSHCRTALRIFLRDTLGSNKWKPFTGPMGVSENGVNRKPIKWPLTSIDYENLGSMLISMWRKQFHIFKCVSRGLAA